MGEAPDPESVGGGLAPGARLGRYTVLERLAQGGMAELYLARQRGEAGFEKVVAIKRVRPHLAGDEAFARLFLNEARLAAGLDHSSIAHVVDFGTEEGMSYIVMEYVHGPSLLEVLRRTAPTPMPRRVALTIVRDVAAALHYAHERTGPDGRPLGLVHRDVSPSNILLTYDGEVKLVDFGIAKATALPQATRSTSIKGKIAYMAPEQAKGETVDRRTDVFALGTVTFELCTARRCFTAPGELALLNKVAAASYPRPSSIDADFCPDLEALIARALAADPEARFPSARAFQQAVEDYATLHDLTLSNLALSDHVVGVCGRPSYPVLEPREETVRTPVTRRRARPWTLAAAGVSLAVGLGVGLSLAEPTTAASEAPVSEPEPEPRPSSTSPDVPAPVVAPPRSPEPEPAPEPEPEPASAEAVVTAEPETPTAPRKRRRKKPSKPRAASSKPVPAYLPPSRRPG